MDENPQGAPTEEALRSMEFDDLPDMLGVLFEQCDIESSSVDMLNAAGADGFISFHIGRTRINTLPDASGKMRFTEDAIRRLTCTKA